MPGLKHHIIGLTGFASAGKDTVGDLLVTHAGFRKLAFADALRGEAANGFHVEPRVFTRRELKDRPLQELAISRCMEPGFLGAALMHLAQAEPTVAANEQLVRPRTPRQILQLWGTEYRRNSDPDYWARQVRHSIGYFMRECHERHFVVCDVRYPNEAETLRNMGGLVWQVTRPGVDAGTTTEGQHSSVTAGDQFAPEAVIANTHDIRHLQQLVLGEFWALDAGLQGVKVQIA